MGVGKKNQPTNQHTTLRTETFKQSTFSAQILLHREVCAQINLYTQTPLHTGVFYAKRFYTQKFLYTDALHKDAFTRIDIKAHRRFYTQNLLHRETFAQNNFYTKTLLHRETLTEKIAHTDCTKKFLHTKTFTQKLYPEQFSHRFFSAQKPLRTEVLCTTVFTPTITDPFTHRCLYTEKTDTETSAHSTLLHSQFFHGETLLPLLDHLPFVFPLSSYIYICIDIICL